jgi:predicted RNA-binding Zn-ribbon protein involved in translation (DUF1610 family)
MLEKDVLCAHCGTPIEDRSTLQTRGDSVYCCPNCANLADGTTGEAAADCAHCGTPMVFIATQVERDGKTYCCLNCAQAVPAASGS